MGTLFEAAGGESGLRMLALAWYERMTHDPVAGYAVASAIDEDPVERLAAYWSEALGGPALYTARYGTVPDVVGLTRRAGDHDLLNDRAVDCFAEALEDAGLQDDERLAEALLDYFTWVTWTTLIPPSAPRPAGPPGIPKWSWDGLDEWP